jgi:pyruvate dehydrogenase E2 component (dihydrolipoamide acetyltransferase)
VADVELPQLGESVTEGIITAWLVEVGDEVEVDQPLVEISTDKVDTEIPSPVAGTVQELRAEVDDTIEVGQVIAVVGEGAPSGDEGDDGDADEDDADEGDADEGDGDGEDTGGGVDAERAGSAGRTDDAAGTGGQEATPQPTDDGSAPEAEGDGGAASVPSGGEVEGEKALTSPLVRKLLRQAGLTPAQVRGSGPGGRITREDADRAIASGGEGGGEEVPAQPGSAPAQPDTAPAQAAQAPAAASVTPAPVLAAPTDRKRPEPAPVQIDFDGQREVVTDLSRVRKAIAKGMLESLQTTAQLTAAVEVDLTAIMNLRVAFKDAFRAQHGASLSPLPLIARAVMMTLPRHPGANSRIDTEAGTATYYNFVNLGMAVDTPRGLLVPNIKDAQDLNVPGLARKIADLAKRTRDKKLQPDEISGGTFTITNTGSRGTLFDTPILNPPEVAILATCAIEKRPVVVSDAYGDSIAIRWMSYLCLTYDHRMLDGADAARFLQDLKYTLETHDFVSELGL